MKRERIEKLITDLTLKRNDFLKKSWEFQAKADVVDEIRDIIERENLDLFASPSGNTFI